MWTIAGAASLLIAVTLRTTLVRIAITRATTGGTTIWSTFTVPEVITTLPAGLTGLATSAGVRAYRYTFAAANAFAFLLLITIPVATARLAGVIDG
ncbi:hypothetical protein GCM10023187_48000 [Nibrella viscosa]|uniref:Uncharacterized protein n=1 Tax=Nibrella viscosa TaxID=1084524 RepID=A0ABP8KUK5_9BACT